jgi:hypothetical protein
MVRLQEAELTDTIFDVLVLRLVLF